METESLNAAASWSGLVGATLIIVGAAFLYLGAKQRRTPIDLRHPPKTTWFAKYFIGIALILAGGGQLAPMLKG